MTIAREFSLNNSIAIRTEDLCRHYRMGETLIRAVDGISLRCLPGNSLRCWALPVPANRRC